MMIFGFTLLGLVLNENTVTYASTTRKEVTIKNFKTLKKIPYRFTYDVMRNGKDIAFGIYKSKTLKKQISSLDVSAGVYYIVSNKAITERKNGQNYTYYKIRHASNPHSKAKVSKLIGYTDKNNLQRVYGAKIRGKDIKFTGKVVNGLPNGTRKNKLKKHLKKLTTTGAYGVHGRYGKADLNIPDVLTDSADITKDKTAYSKVELLKAAGIFKTYEKTARIKSIKLSKDKIKELLKDGILPKDQIYQAVNHSNCDNVSPEKVYASLMENGTLKNLSLDKKDAGELSKYVNLSLDEAKITNDFLKYISSRTAKLPPFFSSIIQAKQEYNYFYGRMSPENKSYEKFCYENMMNDLYDLLFGGKALSIQHGDTMGDLQDELVEEFLSDATEAEKTISNIALDGASRALSISLVETDAHLLTSTIALDLRFEDNFILFK